ncbi:hypothetical protein C8R45DRAFT_1219147 [Mycena sanguinolenta]|nr:hypothetical protein C8R45DRAFT_1219147 [Mycena sanguinolenta]
MALGATSARKAPGRGWDGESKISRRLPPPPGDLFSHGHGGLFLCVACSALLADADAAPRPEATPRMILTNQSEAQTRPSTLPSAELAEAVIVAQLREKAHEEERGMFFDGMGGHGKELGQRSPDDDAARARRARRRYGKYGIRWRRRRRISASPSPSTSGAPTSSTLRPPALARVAAPAPHQHPRLRRPRFRPARRTMYAHDVRALDVCRATVRVPSAFATATVPRYGSLYYISVSQSPKTALAMVVAQLCEQDEVYGSMGWTGRMREAWLIPYTNTGGRTGEGGTVVEGPTHQRYRDGYGSGDVERTLDQLPRPKASASGAVVEMCAAGAEMIGSTISLSVGARLEVAALPSVVALSHALLVLVIRRIPICVSHHDLHLVPSFLSPFISSPVGLLVLVEVVRTISLEQLDEATLPSLPRCRRAPPRAVCLRRVSGSFSRWRFPSPRSRWASQERQRSVEELIATNAVRGVRAPTTRTRRVSHVENDEGEKTGCTASFLI